MKSAKILLIVFALASVAGLAIFMDFSESESPIKLEEFPADSKKIQIDLADGITGKMADG